MKKKSKWNGLEEHYKVATGPKTSTTRYNIFGLVAPANEESCKWNTCKWGPYCTLMPSMVFDVHTVGVGCIIQVCNMSVVVMSAVTGRTHLHWRYRTFKARLIRRCVARLGLRPGSLIRISLFALQTQFCLFIVNLYLQFRFKC